MKIGYKKKRKDAEETGDEELLAKVAHWGCVYDNMGHMPLSLLMILIVELWGYSIIVVGQGIRHSHVAAAAVPEEGCHLWVGSGQW
jgi:hypothetical protein